MLQSRPSAAASECAVLRVFDLLREAAQELDEAVDIGRRARDADRRADCSVDAATAQGVGAGAAAVSEEGREGSRADVERGFARARVAEAATPQRDAPAVRDR